MLLKQHAKVGDPIGRFRLSATAKGVVGGRREGFVMESSEGARTRRGQTVNGGLRPEQEVGGGGAVV